MAPRRGAEVEVEVEEAAEGQSLQFNEPLSWRAGKPIATAELLRRLEALADELRDMDQEEVDKESFKTVAKELSGQNLLSHKDKGVRAYVACCLVDLLKLCAPDAPFSASKLKDIFTLFITQILPALSDPLNAYNTQHRYVLLSLTEVKSIVLLTDIPNSDALTLHLFHTFFDILSGTSKSSTGEAIAKDVEYNMGQMLVIVVDEAASLPPDVIDAIAAQFLRAASSGGGKKHGERADDKQSTLLLKELPESYNMAKTICNSCPEKMARYISQFFNDVILESSPGVSKTNGHRRTSDAVDSEEDEAPTGPSDADMRELHKAHRLLRELWRASPAVLQNVIPQLEAELSADNVQLRLLATETLGDIISGIGAAGPPPTPTMDPAVYPPVRLDDIPLSPVSDSILTTPISPQSFSHTHPTVYHSFMGRRFDKSAVIRSGWTTAIGRILVTSAGGIGLSREDETALVKALGEKVNDPDEKVRLTAIRAIGGFSFRDIMTKLAPNGGVSKPGSVLSNLTDRARDRKHTVQVEGMTTIARIWGVAAGEIAVGNEAVISTLGAIPTKIFDAYYTNDREINVIMDHVMFEQLVPLKYPPGKPKGSKSANGETQGETQTNGDGPYNPDRIRTDRILLVVKGLNPKSKKAFFAMQARQPAYSQVLASFLNSCEDYNGGVMEDDAEKIEAKLDNVIEWYAGQAPDRLRTAHDLKKYAKLHDRRSYQLLRFAMAPESEFKTVYNSIKEFSKRIESASNAPAGLLDTLMPIIYRSSSLVYNRSHLPFIMQHTKGDEDELGAIAHEIMHEISEKHPSIFKDNVQELCKALTEQAPTATKPNDMGSVESLKALALFAKNPNSSKQIPKDRKFISTLMAFAQYGEPPKAAKYAVAILMATSEKKEMHGKDLLDKSTQNWEYGSSHFLTKLATISQLILSDSSIADEANDEILDIATTKLLLQVRTSAMDDDPEWKSEADIDEECIAKCWALKILVNNLRVVHDKETLKTFAVPVYKLLNKLVKEGGEISKNKDSPKYHKSRLRLLAAQSILKLSAYKFLDSLLTPVDFNQLALMTIDPITEVRRGFVEKIQKYLVKNKLSNRFYTIIFLTAFDPDLAWRNSVVLWIRSRAKIFAAQKSRSLESIFPRLLSLLASHPDFSLDPVELVDHAKYILFYINAVISEENLPLVYKYSERVKQARDAVNTTNPKNLYVLADLSMALIKKYQEKKGWIMQTWSEKVGLPVGLFAGLPSHEVAQEIGEKNYLPEPEEIDSLLDKILKEADRKPKRKPDDRDSISQPSKKHKSDSKARASKTPKAKSEKAPKVKKTPAKVRKPKGDGDFSATGVSHSERRKSGRGASAQKSYADRDSSDDDEEMLDGVAKWDYFSEDPDSPGEAKRKRKMTSEAPSESDVMSPPPEEENAEGADVEMSDVERDQELKTVSDKPQEENGSELSDLEEPEHEPQPEDEEQEVEEEEEVEEVAPTPPQTNKKTPSRSSAKKPTPSSSAKSMSKTKAKPATAKPKSSKTPVKPATKGTRSSARNTRASGNE
ncbi:hypothetical protein HYALB_00002765 [Hymenoscyphus albidus]|uniref:Uncharacterized protein n=1 Tax=Hymenoscyphus albidus TaxID=595503 RepID=A0A9N9Q3T5_9HELO|nr:hypothetical protein HYALB_00002765 [Hymenoscyphus albidus]